MSSLDHDDLDTDTETDTEHEAITGAPPPMTSRRALVSAMLDQLDTSAIRRVLTKATPHLVVIETASAQWAKGLSTVINRRYSSAYAAAVTDLKKDGNVGLGKDLLEQLHRHRHLVVCTHDAASLLPTPLLNAADIRFVAPATTPAVMRRAIRLFTGRAPRGLSEADIAGLDFDDLALALRPGSSAADCKKRLQQLKVQAGASAGSNGSAKSIAELPLSEPVAAWADDLLAQIRDVEQGVMSASDLPYTLLYGPAGTGKTTIAAAVAKSAGWRFVSTSVGEWFSSSDGHLGGVSKACTQFIDSVLAEPKTFGFIDEIDGIPDRANLDVKDREWWTPVVNLVLLQIDRVRRSGKPALLLAATNYPERLDASLTRGGRIERHVPVLPPSSEKEVAAVLRFYLGDSLSQASLEEAARLGLGATAATIEGWVRAARAAARSDGRDLDSADLLDAVAPPDGRSADELYATALHEAGHAIVAHHLGIRVTYASILGHGATGGSIRTEAMSHFPDRDELERTATVYLGGRAADIVLGKGPHAGAQLDLEMATHLLSRGVSEFGLYDTLAYRDVGATGREALAHVEPVLQRLLHAAIAIVQERQEQIEKLAMLLLQHRVLDEGAIVKALSATAAGAKKPSCLRSSVKEPDSTLVTHARFAGAKECSHD